MRYLITLLAVAIISMNALCQIDYEWHNSVTVADSTNTNLKFPWAGGFNAPQFSNIDLNRDGILDIFVFDRDHNVIKTFIKNTAIGTEYTYAPEYIDSFPELTNFTLLVDYNCDGEKDIFTFKQGGCGVFRNDYLTNGFLSFTQVTDPYIKYPINGFYTNAYVATVDVPAIEDIDGDGDIDLLSFDILGSFVGYYQNQSMDLYGHCDSLIFIEKEGCWGNFQEAFGSNSLTLGISCPKSLGGNNTDSRHSGSTLLAINIDGIDNPGNSNMDKEILIGDISFPNISMLVNGGDADSANMVSQDSLFPIYDKSISLAFPAVYHIDVDGDGEKDLVASTNSVTSGSAPSENIHNSWYYRNTEHTDSCIVSFQNSRFLQEDMIEVGSYSNPVLFDYNADNKLDLVIGTYGYFDTTSASFTAKLTLYKNIGTSISPAFEYVTDDYANVSSLGVLGLAPCFGDLDSDGDLDMLVGDINGQVHYFQNVAGSSSPANFVLGAAVYKGIDVGSYAKPFLFDLNNDNLLDIVIGEDQGTLKYFENIGTSSIADFSSTATTSNFGGIKVGIYSSTGNSSPVLINDNGATTLYVGDTHGFLQEYTNIDNNLQGSFTFVDSLDLNSGRISPTIGKLFGNTNDALLYGEALGGVGFLKKAGAVGLNRAEYNSDLVIFPNPSSDKLYISKKSEDFQFTIMDVLGKICKVQSSTTGKFIELDIQHLKNGTYFIEGKDSQGTYQAKFQKQ
jgi:hypothetical protein